VKVLTRIQIGMDKSIGIIGCIITLLTLLFVVHVSHPITRRFLTEGFAALDYTKPSVDLTTEPDFMAFYKFHTDVCALWNGVIDEAMKNDCVDPSSPESIQARKDAEKSIGDRPKVTAAPPPPSSPCPTKPAYIKSLLDVWRLVKKNNNICFINCDKVWDAKSSLIDLLAAVPLNINCYRDTLQFLIYKTQDTINQANDAINRANEEQFADYKTTIDCKPGAKGITQCTDDKGNIYILKPAETKQESQKEIDLALKQKTDTNTIIGRCRIMVAEIPGLKDLMNMVKQNIETLKALKKRVESGEIRPS